MNDIDEQEHDNSVDYIVQDLLTNPLILEEYGDVSEEEILELISGGFIPFGYQLP